VEVKPVLEVLVGKTVEQSLLEVMEEEELSNLREQQRQFQELRNAELVEQQRLEEEDRRRRAEKVLFCSLAVLDPGVGHTLYHGRTFSICPCPLSF